MVRLDINEKLETVYCIPLWLRDEQVKHAISKVTERIKPHEKRDEPCAIVTFGPSLEDTWEEVKNFKYIFTCSGAHKFLVEKGIIPTYHVEVDPREHKIKLIGEPQKETEYLIASTCHPKYFEHLEGFNVKLWHVFSNEADAFRLLPRGDWAVFGGSSVGLRAMTIARFLGFHNQHVFGMDGCIRKYSHAAEHPNAPPSYVLTEYKGKDYKTTASMLECARQTFHELDMMPDVNPVFYGDGLVKAMHEDYVRKKVSDTTIAINKPELISAEYVKQNKQLHQENLAYGVGGGKHAPTVVKLANSVQSNSVLDYGCGKGYLAKNIPFPIWEYDPAIEGKNEPPRPADIVVCTDVLEHIEPEKLDFVLDDLARCTKKIGYFVISTRAAMKTLPDGRNTHLIVKDKNWWQKRLKPYFKIGTVIDKNSELHVVVAPKKYEAKNLHRV